MILNKEKVPSIDLQDGKFEVVHQLFVSHLPHLKQKKLQMQNV